MKIAALFLICLFICNCDSGEKLDDNFCGVKDPKNDLIWLKEIISIAETHQNVHYMGYIYAELYSKRDVIYVEMSLGFSGLMGHWFNCDGTDLIFSINSPPSPTKKRLIYSNVGN